MPRLVNSIKYTVHGRNRNTDKNLSTVNCQLSTVYPERNRRVKPAFTLIELLIVIAIISVLSAAGFFGYQSSQKRARDAQRKSDLTQVKKALESAKNDCLAGSYYPYAADFTALSAYLKDADLKYLATTVKDPKDASPYQYTLHLPTSTPNVCTNNAGTSNSNDGIKSYVLRATLEIANDPDTNKSITNCSNAISLVTISPAPAANDGYLYVCSD